MRVIWLGIEDVGGCVLHWNDLRRRLHHTHGVELHGPDYSWPLGQPGPRLSELLEKTGTPDWLVLDDCNAKGYVNMKWDCTPDCKVAVREHDWWNRHRGRLHDRIKPDLVMGCYDRPLDVYRRDVPGWTLVPHPVNTRRFAPNGSERPYPVGYYGKHGKMYGHRTVARRAIRDRGDAWIGQHGGYWHVKENNDGVHTFYNEKLAEKLAQCKSLWVDSPDNKHACVLKYFEGAASGCLLIGQMPFNREAYFPDGTIIPCEPEEVSEVVDWYADHDAVRKNVTESLRDYVVQHHSVEARAKQVMDLLREER